MPRQRRSAIEAREMILDAAEKHLKEAGPASIRLQDVAADVGISHPAVLHHFGSRERLVQAVVSRAIARLQVDLVSMLSDEGDEPPDGQALFEQVFETLSERGHARTIAWLVLSGYDPFDSETARTGWETISKMTHAMRVQAHPRKHPHKKPPSYQDTRFTVVLSALSLFGLAITGDATLRAAGFRDERRTGRAFRKWFAALLAHHLDRSGDET